MGIKMKALEAVRNLGQLLNSVGMLYGGQRDIYRAYGYKRQILYRDMHGKYIRQDIAKRIIDMPANGVWALPPEVAIPGKGEKVFQDFIEQFDLWQVFNRADKMAGMGDYSTILVGVNDGKPLNTPVTPNQDLKILYFQPYSIEHMQIQLLQADTTNPRYGKPLLYTLKRPEFPTPGPTRAGAPAVDMQVHHSRIIHVAENVLEDECFGVPRLGNVYNLLDDLLKIGGGSAEIYWLNARAGMQIDVDKDINLQPEDEAALTEEVDDYINDLRRVIRTRGTKVNMLDAKMADPRMSFQVTLSLISAATGIPQRILVGAEAGQLASAQDRANWSSYLEDRRANFAEPGIMKPFFKWMAGAGLLKIEDVAKITMDWPEAFKLSPLERSQTSAQQARAAANLSKVLQITPQLLSEDDMRKIISLAAPTSDTISPGTGKTLVPGAQGGFGSGGKGTKHGKTPGKTVDTGTAKDKVTKT